MSEATNRNDASDRNATPTSRRDMTPEERAAAIKAVQEKALKLKAEREAARAAVKELAGAGFAQDPTGWIPPALAARRPTASRFARLPDRCSRAAAAAAGGEAAVTPVPAAPAGPAGAAWRIPAAGGAQQVTIARPDIRQMEEVRREEREVRMLLQRRQLLRGGVFASLLGFIILSAGSFLNFFNPRHGKGFGGVITIRAADVPKEGDGPKYFIDMKG